MLNEDLEDQPIERNSLSHCEGTRLVPLLCDCKIMHP